MADEDQRIRQLERQVRFLTATAVVALVAAVLSAFGLAGRSAQDLRLAGGASLEMDGRDLRITLPSSASSIVLQASSGEEIARLGNPGPRQLGE